MYMRARSLGGRGISTIPFLVVNHPVPPGQVVSVSINTSLL
jgi:hypothetical protein